MLIQLEQIENDCILNENFKLSYSQLWKYIFGGEPKQLSLMYFSSFDMPHAKSAHGMCGFLLTVKFVECVSY